MKAIVAFDASVTPLADSVSDAAWIHGEWDLGRYFGRAGYFGRAVEEADLAFQVRDCRKGFSYVRQAQLSIVMHAQQLRSMATTCDASTPLSQALYPQHLDAVVQGKRQRMLTCKLTPLPATLSQVFKSIVLGRHRACTSTSACRPAARRGSAASSCRCPAMCRGHRCSTQLDAVVQGIRKHM
jgi:hypothetical protein